MLPNDVNHPLVLYPIIGENASNYKEFGNILLFCLLLNMCSEKVCIYMMLFRMFDLVNVIVTVKT